MSPYSSDITEASISLWRSAKAFWRRVPRLLRRIAMAAVAIAVPWLLATFIAHRAVDAEIEAITSEGSAVTLAELAPSLSPGILNAAPIYKEALESLADVDAGEYEHLNADLDYARASLPSYQAAFDQMRRASEIRTCVFPTDWRQPVYELVFPHYAQLRQAVRLLVLDSGVLAADGKADRALVDLAAAYRTSAHIMSDPILISPLVGYAVIGTAHDGLEEALSVADPSPAACRAAYDALALIDVETPFHRGLQGERAAAIAVFEDVRSHRVPLSNLTGGGADWLRIQQLVGALYPTLGAPLLTMDEATSLRLFARMIEAHKLPWPDSQNALDGIHDDADSLPAYRSLVTRMVLPVFGRADLTRRNAAATLAVDRAALAVAAFKTQVGHYPDALAQVESLGWNLPEDPFTGGPLVYRRTGRGFALWSVGPNMRDDGGAEYDDKTMDFTSGAYDIAFLCGPGRVAAARAARKAAWDADHAEQLDQGRSSDQRSGHHGRGFRRSFFGR